MPHRLIHGYLTADLNIVWSTVKDVLPGFKAKIALLLGAPPSPEESAS